MSSSPPTFNPPQAAPSGSKLWLWVLLAVVAFCLIACGIGFFMMRGVMGSIMPTFGCTITGDMVTKATLAYAIEHDGRLPNAETWQDDIAPYYERLYAINAAELEEIPDVLGMDFKVSPPGQPFECDWKEGPDTGFVFNEEFSEVLVDDIENPRSVILIFESSKYGYNASGNPDDRTGDPPDMVVMGDRESREWFDFDATGHGDLLDSLNADFDMEISIEDALSDPGSEPDDAVEPDEAEEADEPE
ncbi:MAG: hypothetical protein IH944_11375 [Armatimonadetes bacterium]|nr:hypothetical protein [Armatimonadota bacterium]